MRTCVQGRHGGSAMADEEWTILLGEYLWLIWPLAGALFTITTTTRSDTAKRQKQTPLTEVAAAITSTK
ncbi:hypothetical protein Pmani_022986 [Petrolisthes manimaculis]|uniref:Uncharacterized protein n=1 Tax=Petrolisthes manimaculis TaxID=1843537 RepID=A0AAE1PD74_9EUCA|nr:hypothetical protein Pmani_022986 [Petrolisthes manimaculis]